MSSEAIQPSSLDGIKRLAKSLKTERGIQHARALDDAARAAGFQNFRHASNVLRHGAVPTRTRPGHRVYVTCLGPCAVMPMPAARPAAMTATLNIM